MVGAAGKGEAGDWRWKQRCSGRLGAVGLMGLAQGGGVRRGGGWTTCHVLCSSCADHSSRSLLRSLRVRHDGQAKWASCGQGRRGPDPCRAPDQHSTSAWAAGHSQKPIHWVGPYAGQPVRVHATTCTGEENLCSIPAAWKMLAGPWGSLGCRASSAQHPAHDKLPHACPQPGTGGSTASPHSAPAAHSVCCRCPQHPAGPAAARCPGKLDSRPHGPPCYPGGRS